MRGRELTGEEDTIEGIRLSMRSFSDYDTSEEDDGKEEIKSHLKSKKRRKGETRSANPTILQRGRPRARVVIECHRSVASS